MRLFSLDNAAKSMQELRDRIKVIQNGGTDSQSPSIKPGIDVIAWLGFSLTLSLFFPLVFNLDFGTRGSVEEHNFASISCQIATACSLSLCFPLLVDVILDYASRGDFTEGHLSLRCISVFALVAFNIIYLATINYDNFHEIQHVCGYCQLCAEFTMLLWLLKKLDVRSLWTVHRIIVLLVCLYLYLLTSYLAYLFPTDNATFFTISKDFSYALVVFFVLNSGIWVYTTVFEYYQKSQKGSLKILAADYYIIIILISSIIAMLSFVIMIAAIANAENRPADDDIAYTAEFQVGAIVLRSMLTFLLNVLPGRMYRQKAMEYRYDSEVKSSLVAYLSHEMRTPVSIISLGLEVLATQIKNEESMGVLLASLSELEASCGMASDVLDNLLLYEKIRKDTLQLDLSEVQAIPYLCNALQPIVSTIKSTQVKFSLLDPLRNDLNELKLLKLKVHPQLFGAQLVKMVNIALADSKQDNVLELRMEILAKEECLSPRSPSTRSIAPVYAVPSDRLRILLRLTSPLSVETKRCFQEIMKDAKMEREAGGGLSLSTWVLQQVSGLHSGQTGYLSIAGYDHLYADIPFERDEALENCNISCLNEFRNNMKTKREFMERVASTSLARAPLEGFDAQESMSLLVIDDSDMNRKMIVRVMNNLQHRCTEGNDGDVAVSLMAEAMAEGEVYDAVLLDNEMPVMRGRDAVKKMREMGYKGVVLGVTGNGLQEDIDDFKRMGVDDVVLKPLTTAKFLQAMEQLKTNRVMQLS